MADQSQEKTKNCVVCKKVVHRVKRYYRDGKYYCNKNCWKSAKVKSAAKQEKA